MLLNISTSHQETNGHQEEASTGKQYLGDSDPEFPENLWSIDPAIVDMSTAKGSLNDHLQKLIQEHQGLSPTLQLSLSGYMPEQDQVFSADPATTDLSETMNMLREHLPLASLTQYLLAPKVLLDYLRPMKTIHPTNPIPSSHPSNELDRPKIDLSRPPMTSND